jgi:hypothetical protein
MYQLNQNFREPQIVNVPSRVRQVPNHSDDLGMVTNERLSAAPFVVQRESRKAAIVRLSLPSAVR